MFMVIYFFKNIFKSTHSYVEDEIRSEISVQHFLPGPTDRMAALFPGSMSNHDHTFLVEDRYYLSARFWGDAYAFAQRFANMLNQRDENSKFSAPTNLQTS